MRLNRMWVLVIALSMVGCSQKAPVTSPQLDSTTIVPVNTKKDPQVLVRNGTSFGGIPITSQIGGNAACVQFIESGDYAKVIGISDKGNWLLIDYYGRATGWIPAWTTTPYTFDNETFSLPIKATEPQNVYRPRDHEIYLRTIQDFTGNAIAEPVFICYSPIQHAPERLAAVYVDSLGSTYFVSIDIPQIVFFGSGRESVISVDMPPDHDLNSLATKFATEHSKGFENYQEKMEVSFHGKGDGNSYMYIFRGYLYLNEPCNGMDFKMIQIILDGKLISYQNTLDLEC